MIGASCHCGAVHLEIDAPPSEVTECNCSICRRYGVLWAYYTPEQVSVSSSHPPTDVYVWNGKTTEFHHCRICGCVSHWTPTDRDRMGVNARLMEPEILGGARVRHLDGADTDEYIDWPTAAAPTIEWYVSSKVQTVSGCVSGPCAALPSWT